MKNTPAANRRSFLQQSATAAAGLFALPDLPTALAGSVRSLAPSSKPADWTRPAGRIRFAVIGIHHAHIFGQVDAVTRGGGELVSYYSTPSDVATAFAKRYPQAKAAGSEAEILDDNSIQLVVSAAIPDQRAPIGIRVMQHGKDYLSDKPGITSLEQLADVRRVQQATKRIYSIMYSERLEQPATVRAGELVRAGAIGKVVQTLGMGPHRISLNTRPDWFFDRKRYGGILCDIGSHQCDQFLYFTNSTKADVLSAQALNVNHPQYPNFEDFGDITLRGDGGSGYVRVDWFTPNGLPTWGDGRLTILGTDGYIELRKYVDITGRPGGNHLFLVDQKGTHYQDCKDVPLPFGPQLVDDVLNRTETAMPQAHCFLATELALKAQQQAGRSHGKT